MRVIDSLIEGTLQHQARSFPALPGPDQALPLLDEIATEPCAFAPVAADRPLALYGAGNLGRLARDFLKFVGRDFIMAIDLNAGQVVDNWHDVRLLHPDDVPVSAKREVRLAVSIVSSPYVPLEQYLLESGFKDVVPFYDLAESLRHLHPLSNGWFAPPLGPNDRKKSKKVLARWDDDISRAHHLQFLAWRRLREEWTFAGAPMPDCPRFFIPEVTEILHDDEVLLDAGAHHGRVTEVFLTQVKGMFREIVAIEPDPLNRARLAENLQSRLSNDARVTIHSFALAETESEALFHDGLDYASQLSETGRMRVAVRPLDALGLSPTFVKLHLEGADLAALKGAQQTLRTSRPIIAATVYHNADGIWRTPLWLMETLSDYQFLFRAHTWCGTGAVVYAIPKERAGFARRAA
jgi:FkbM family methyltransferase